MSPFELPLSEGQWIVAGVLMAIALIAGFVNFAVLAHVSRMRLGSRISNRLLPFGLGAWHIGMLRRDWYPEDALPLRRWALVSYATSIACLIILGGFVASWGENFLKDLTGDESRRRPCGARLQRVARLVVVISALVGGRVGAQTPAQLREVHDQMTTLIREMLSRPLTPGDTFLTWNPDPGGLIHTVAADSARVRSSLLRGDGMIGTADVRWANQRPSRFDVQWTTRDSATRRSTMAREAHGVLQSGLLRVTGTKSDMMRVPVGLWVVMDYGMDEQLIPLIRALSANSVPQLISVFRPWHGRWDSLTVTVRDTAGLRAAELLGADKLHEVMLLTARGDLLLIIRYDQPAERRPLEGSSRYKDYVAQRDLLLAIAKRYLPASSKLPDSR